MERRKLKSFVVPLIYGLTLFVLGVMFYLIERTFNNNNFNDMEYVSKEIVTDNEYIPVVSQNIFIMKPFISDKVMTNKSFYNKDGDIKEQENSLVFYEGIYMQNTGISYQSEEEFDIVSILDGEVIEITNNEILGTTIKIKHDKDIISVYQSIKDIIVKEKDHITRGQVIAKSGNSKLYSKNNNLHFELNHQGVTVNPLEYYNKNIDEMNN